MSENLKAQLWAQLDWEGGLDALLMHGVNDYDIPDDLKVRWYEMVKAWDHWTKLADPILEELQDAWDRETPEQ